MSDDFEPGRTERLSSQIGKNAAEVAGLDRVFAGLRELRIARFGLAVSCENMSRSLANFAATVNALDVRLDAEATA